MSGQIRKALVYSSLPKFLYTGATLGVGVNEIIELEVLKWAEYQHHNGERTYDWFKLSSKLIYDPQMCCLTAAEFRIWITILCLCAQQRSNKIELTRTSLSKFAQVRTHLIQSCVIKLQSFQIVRIVSGTIEENRVEEKRKEKKTTYATNDKKLSFPAIVIPELFDTLTNDLVIKAPEKLQRSWLQTYPDILWLKNEFKHANNWILANPAKAPKSAFGKFLNSWLKRGWENYRKTLSPISKPVSFNKEPGRPKYIPPSNSSEYDRMIEDKPPPNPLVAEMMERWRNKSKMPEGDL